MVDRSDTGEEPACSIAGDAAEDARLASLRSYNILDTSPEQSFDRITRLASMALQMPAVMISMIDRDRQWFKSKQGVDMTEMPRSTSFCTHTIQQGKPFIVSDASIHPLFQENPLVTGEHHVRFYAGIPLTMRDGYNIGTLCAVDMQPRALSSDEINILSDLARMVIDGIELRQIATTDSLTGALTRREFDNEMAREFSRSKRYRHELSFIAVDIDHFKSVNDRYGHAPGDMVLQSVVTWIKQELRSMDIVARFGGEEFVVALPETSLEGAEILAERIRQRIAAAVARTHGNAIRVTASFGIAGCMAADDNWTRAIEDADAALYEAKRSGRNKCVTHGRSPDTAAA